MAKQVIFDEEVKKKLKKISLKNKTLRKKM